MLEFMNVKYIMMIMKQFNDADILHFPAARYADVGKTMAYFRNYLLQEYGMLH
jgi:hypothetical protein